MRKYMQEQILEASNERVRTIK